MYGVAYCPLDRVKELKELGVDDSKKLTAQERNDQLAGIRSRSEWLGWTVRVLTPQDISSSMLQRYGDA